MLVLALVSGFSVSVSVTFGTRVNTHHDSKCLSVSKSIWRAGAVVARVKVGVRVTVCVIASASASVRV